MLTSHSAAPKPQLRHYCVVVRSGHIHQHSARLDSSIVAHRQSNIRQTPRSGSLPPLSPLTLPLILFPPLFLNPRLTPLPASLFLPFSLPPPGLPFLFLHLPLSYCRMLSMIQLRYSVTLVYTPGTFSVPQRFTPNDTTPTTW